MIVLDTNIVSETMRPSPDRSVMEWLRGLHATELAVTAISMAEIQRGLLRLPEGKKRGALLARFTDFADEAFAGRVLAFDRAAAHRTAEASAAREAAGLHAEMVDMMIAGIVLERGLRLATRNTRDFEGCGLRLMNPFAEQGEPGR
ncbi:type II toxin-antitoxin system VapC family toxin [Parvularcula maris]|uniref:Ribonuclease VapC n=1 Tax=Parvularcula maris TaxID=2965077 RepID=A0A9X2RKA1_9PROT|nr:type II toxin-antitoxin system VapC family toxin [Parvularcula maris]MCQ8185417.1 type II toxin-antitoxin system VapC family toxin [Parvularcula maris]